MGAEVVFDGALQRDLGVEPCQWVLGGLPEGHRLAPGQQPAGLPRDDQRVVADRLSTESSAERDVVEYHSEVSLSRGQQFDDLCAASFRRDDVYVRVLGEESGERRGDEPMRR